ncbi:HIT family protein [Aquisalimonas asiatica]|uniref:Diadenosine tetraphosphate (Ap4A) hydrolase n=1 Tax=Aquisalimonas asiatica TaxID=406100 RepID=A0A1H8PTQ1_9GAMM|nr:HIT family protein [Aquisalimonas asiatica]SEO45077.1 Diadenosine tetraphosphate (Ap4A) hydrolase [Aquisalimonas asiatica]
MTVFAIHEQLQADCHVLGGYGACSVLLHRNGSLPWYIVVPETRALELDELSDAERIAVDGVTDALARFIKGFHRCERTNVAAIGNRVPQLHVHVVGRWQGDPCWPDPVWGNLPDAPPRSEAQLQAIRSALTEALPA